MRYIQVFVFLAVFAVVEGCSIDGTEPVALSTAPIYGSDGGLGSDVGSDVGADASGAPGAPAWVISMSSSWGGGSVGFIDGDDGYSRTAALTASEVDAYLVGPPLVRDSTVRTDSCDSNGNLDEAIAVWGTGVCNKGELCPSYGLAKIDCQKVCWRTNAAGGLCEFHGGTGACCANGACSSGACQCTDCD